MKTHADEVQGVPLGEIASALQKAGIEVERHPAELRFRGNLGTTEIRVVEPSEPSLDKVPLQSVVLVRTVLPDGVHARDPAFCAELNRLAAFGSLMSFEGKPSVVSRLTTHEGEDHWGLHGRLLVWAAVFAPDAFDRDGPPRFDADKAGESGADREWPAADFALLECRFGGHFACSSDGRGFTTEVSLRGGCGAAAAGDSHTALIEMGAIESHPVLGPGLHALLNLPHRYESLERVQRAVMELNAWEARPADMVPHYGAWCVRKVRNPAYTCFFPRRLWHPGFVLNLFTWMVARARMADGFLVARGVVSGMNRIEGGHRVES